jgi:hypothetical protein
MLTSERRQECADGSRVLLETLKAHQQFEFRDIMTEDDSWNYLSTHPNSIWIRAEKVFARPDPTKACSLCFQAFAV